MPVFARHTSARPHTTRALTATLMLGLVTGLGLAAPAATPVAHAAPQTLPQTETPATPTSAETNAADTAAKGRAAQRKARIAKRKARIAKRKALRAKRARVAARRAKWSKIRQIGRAKNVALAQRGDAYVYGATGPNAFDCSGLVQYAYHRAGFKGMPRTSGAQAAHTRRISKAAMKPGDLMFFANGGGVYHVGIFAGRGKGGTPLMVHASRPGTPVQTAAPWTSSWFAGTVR
ncbi:C40 family peptidase [Nocardioides campestrisoli]|uniref:C40 family peptidase n=1 Tax=Nocardioides campestrisoli TaxID=2736757 RepID=UPI001CD70E64|nr:C40 family peptidase [Nocardioides campestrisoli]